MSAIGKMMLPWEDHHEALQTIPELSQRMNSEFHESHVRTSQEGVTVHDDDFTSSDNIVRARRDPAPRKPQRPGLDRRTSSFQQRWDSLMQKGSRNSLENFRKSLQRVANAREITPRRKASVVVEAGDSDEEDAPVPTVKNRYRRSFPQKETAESPRKAASKPGSENSSQTFHLPHATETSTLLGHHTHVAPTYSTILRHRRGSVVGTTHGSASSLMSASAQRRASILADEHIRTAIRVRLDAIAQDIEIQHPRIEIHDTKDGELVTEIVGGSTGYMTVFNTVNCLTGIGMLALPLGFAYTGWVVGLVLFTAFALVTFYTANLLVKCLETNTAALTYGDISFLAFGTWGRRCVEVMFFMEMMVVGTSLIVLFGDSIHQLVPGISAQVWQAVVAIALLPLNFTPFKYLSLTSVLGIFCTLGLIVLVFADGMSKPDRPGSLLDCASTDVLPSNLKAIPLGIGLFMSPWGGHPVVPAIYRDMRNPENFRKTAEVSYVLSYLFNISMGILGYLMFGDKVLDEITASILESNFYPATLSVFMILLIALVSTTKLPLIARPIIDTIESKVTAVKEEDKEEQDQTTISEPKNKVGRHIAAILVNVVQLGIALLFPKFDKIMALLGSLFCFTICIVLPISFYLKIFSKEGSGISRMERAFCWVLVFLSAGLGILGTIYAVVPRTALGLRPRPT